jgi:uncharacterized membrane protein
MAPVVLDSVVSGRLGGWRTLFSFFVASLPGVAVACPDCAPDELVPLQLAANARGALVGLLALTLLLVVAVTVAGACLKYTRRLLFAGAMLIGGGLGAFVEGAIIQNTSAIRNTPIARDGSLLTAAEWFSQGNFGLYCWAAALLGCVVLFTESPNVMAFIRNRLVPGGMLAGWGMFNILAAGWEFYVFNGNAGQGMGMRVWAFGFLASGLLLTGTGVMLAVQAWRHKSGVVARAVRRVHAH